MSDISRLLAPSYLEIYEKNREFIENNPDYKFTPPKGNIVLSDDTNDLKQNVDKGKEIREVVKLEEDTMPSKIIE